MSIALKQYNYTSVFPWIHREGAVVFWNVEEKSVSKAKLFVKML